MELPKNTVVLVVVIVAVLGGIAYMLRGRGGIPFFSEDEAAIELTITYVDDTEKTFTPIGLQTTSLKITDDTGKEVKSVKAVTKIKVDWEGQYVSQKTVGTMKIYVDSTSMTGSGGIGGMDLQDLAVTPQGQLQDTHRFTYENDLVKGSFMGVGNVEYTGAGLEAWCDYGSNTIQIVVDLTVTMTFKDGSTDSMSGDGGVLFYLNKSSEAGGGLTVVDVAVTRTLLR